MRGDGCYRLADGTVLVIDVTITAVAAILSQPGPQGQAPTIPQRLLHFTGAAAADGESAKRELLGARWIIPNETFYPLSFEVHGAASPSTHAFIERVARTVYPDAGDFGGRRAAFTSMFRQRISVALQTANAQAIARWRRLSWSPRVVVGAGVAPV